MMFSNTMEALRQKMRPKVLPPFESSEWCYQFSRNVRLDWHAVREVATDIYDAMSRGDYGSHKWKTDPLHPKTLCDGSINWIFLVDSLNFSFWAEEGKEWAITWRGVEYVGYKGLCAGVNRALDQGIPFTDPAYYAHVTEDQVRRIFRAHRPGNENVPSEMPMLKERTEIMNFNGKVLADRGNNFAALIVKSKHSCKILLRKILDRFPNFRDETFFKGKKISFYKRAQIVIADINSLYENSGIGYFHDIDELTAFADYRVPQMLYFQDVLIFSPSLIQRIISEEVMEFGDEDEVCIRAGTIYAVERIKQHVNRLQRRHRNDTFHINSVLVDYWLWDNRRVSCDIDKRLKHHRCRSIYY